MNVVIEISESTAKSMAVLEYPLQNLTVTFTNCDVGGILYI